jgi:hypothetical protein
MANTAHDRAAEEVAQLRREIEKHNQKLVQSNLKPTQTRFGLGD